MSDTRSTKPSGGKPGKKRNIAGMAGASVVGVGVGAVAAKLSDEISHGDEAEEIVDAAEGTDTSDVEEVAEAVATMEEPEEEPEEALAEELAEEEDVLLVEAVPVEEDSNVESHPSAEREEIEPEVNPEPAVPTPVPDSMIREINIDPNDIDAEDLFIFDNIVEIYTVSGESYTGAEFHDIEGNNLLMVDVDGDDVFDKIIDSEGYVVANVSDLTTGHISVADAQVAIAGNDQYLAHQENDHTDEYGSDSIDENIISNA